MTDKPARSLRPILDPRSVAVIGASDNPTRIGGRPLKYMLENQFAGPLYPVNANRDTVQGIKAYKSVLDLPETVDCAVIAVPAPHVVQAIEDCASKGVGGAVILSSGFAEAGGVGIEWQEQLTEISERTGIRLLGPNCLGVFNARSGWMATFSSSVERFPPRPGGISIASQSGAYGSHLYSIAVERGISMTHWITTGNQSDVDVAECIEYFAQDTETKTIVAYAEGAKDGDRLRGALALARDNNKPVIFMKVGRTEVGAEAAASHTASLAGSDAVYDAMFKQYGVWRVETTDEMLDLAYACQADSFPNGNKIGLCTLSGGVGVQMADAAAMRGLDVAPMPEDAQAELKALLPFAAVRNPVDITAQAFNDMTLVSTNMRMMLERGGYDAIVSFFTVAASARSVADDLIREVSIAKAAFPDRLMFMSIVGGPDIVKLYEDAGFLIYEDPTRAVNAAAAMMHFGRTFARGAPDAALPLPAGALPAPENAVSEDEAKRILGSAGIPVVTETLTTTRDAAIAAWRQVGGPVVLKIASPDIAHKTEIGGVLLNLNDKAAVGDGHDLILKRVKTAHPSAKLEGVIAAPMITGGVEVVIGVTNDPTFGPAVMFGLGGILVEVLKDVTFRLAPFGVDEAHRMIREIKGFPILEGVRGAAASDIDALADSLAALSVFAHENANMIESIDINPFIVLPKGEGAVAVDALIVPRSPT